MNLRATLGEITELLQVSREQARRGVMQVLGEADLPPTAVEELIRTIQLERTEELLQAVWKPATARDHVAGFTKEGEVIAEGPDPRQSRIAIRLLQRQAKLTGVDAPDRKVLEVRGGLSLEHRTDAELARAEARIEAAIIEEEEELKQIPAVVPSTGGR